MSLFPVAHAVMPGALTCISCRQPNITSMKFVTAFASSLITPGFADTNRTQLTAVWIMQANTILFTNSQCWGSGAWTALYSAGRDWKGLTKKWCSPNFMPILPLLVHLCWPPSRTRPIARVQGCARSWPQRNVSTA